MERQSVEYDLTRWCGGSLKVAPRPDGVQCRRNASPGQFSGGTVREKGSARGQLNRESGSGDLRQG